MTAPYAHSLETLWMVRPEALQGMLHVLADRRGQAPAAGGRTAAAARVTRGAAVVELVGPLSKRRTWLTDAFGGTAMDEAAAEIRRAAADPAVKTIVLYCRLARRHRGRHRRPCRPCV
jgi:ClpP class serine protease